MVQHKAQLKKQQKRGVDFKKIKRKIGRKLPPPKNTTNTEVKSKAIILPEQSLASEKAGLAVSKKGLTLKELLQQTSHHNAKVRRDALIGIRDIFLKHPAQLKMHRLSVIEKLRERMSDEDRIVRETLYQLLKAVIFPACKEDNQGTFISLMMAYVFNAMTHLAFDVRLMAFKFFDLLVQHYPMSFSMYAEKIIQHYQEILQKNQFNLHDKGKLKSVLAGLAYCLSLLPDVNSSTENAVADPRILHAFESQLHEDGSAFPVTAKELMGLLPILVGGLQDFMPSVQIMPNLETQSFDCVLSLLKSIHLVVKFFVYGNPKVSPPSNRRDQDVLQMLLKKLFTVFPLNPTHQSSEKEDNRYFILNVIVSEIFFCLSDWSAPPSVFLEKFLVFLVDALSEKVCGTGKAFFQKHSLPLIRFIPKLMMQVDDTWKSHILQAFTEVFKKCDPESSMKLVCLSAIEEMLFPKNTWANATSDSEMLEFKISWIREIPLVLSLLGDKNPLSSKAVLRVQLELGQCGIMKSEFDSMQLSLREFYSTSHDGDGDISYGAFMKLPREIQEVCISCLYYFSFLDPSLLQSVAACCLSEDVDPFLLFRLLEVVSCGYRAGHIQIADYISFLITIPSRYTVFPEHSDKSNSGLFRRVTSGVCCCLSQIGDDHLVLKMVEGTLIHQISNMNTTNEAGLENACALLRMITRLDSNPTRLSEESISKLGNLLPGYLLHVVSNVGEEEDGRSRRRGYYVLPCFVLLSRSERIVYRVLKVMRTWTCEKPRIIAVVGVLLLMHDEDVRRGGGSGSGSGSGQIFKKIAAAPNCKEEIDGILHNIIRVMSDDDDDDDGYKLNMEEKHKLQYAYDRLKIIIGG
ncbi:unnamed protein product [Lactuca saligna]|uniref:Pre-rRNA-processing protein Ipi1 N-terminal domain-containing protein n=1 Tax=Lactuca saligna TaxID=75948 RepID=A0AA35YHX1_LACSI|nr:unnamed protein product [Lactuca saligna]